MKIETPRYERRQRTSRIIAAICAVLIAVGLYVALTMHVDGVGPSDSAGSSQ